MTWYVQIIVTINYDLYHESSARMQCTHWMQATRSAEEGNSVQNWAHVDTWCLNAHFWLLYNRTVSIRLFALSHIASIYLCVVHIHRPCTRCISITYSSRAYSRYARVCLCVSLFSFRPHFVLIRDKVKCSNNSYLILDSNDIRQCCCWWCTFFRKMFTFIVPITCNGM